LKYIVHGGADRIGGMCIEVEAVDATRVILDLGMPLYDHEGNDFPWGTAQLPTEALIGQGVIPDVRGLYASDSTAPSIAAILVSHAHLDHHGLTRHAHSAIPVYASPGTVSLLNASSEFFPTQPLPADLRQLPSDSPLAIGSLAITPIPVDHAAPDSRAFLVEADGQRILYTGDFRAHGRTGYRFETMLDDDRLKNLDCLLMEGTTLGSDAGAHGLTSEDEVEDGLLELCHANRNSLVAVFASGQNLDRLVSCYRAAKRSGRQLVISAYQAFILREIAHLSSAVPQFDWSTVRVKFLDAHYRALKAAGHLDLVYRMQASKVSTEQLAADPGDFLWCTSGNTPVTRILNHVGAEKVVPVWSMWRGYYDKDPSVMRAWAERKSVVMEFVHCGGHASPADLKRLLEALGPKQYRLVHTTQPSFDLSTIG
jgi:ribonuclease J